MPAPGDIRVQVEKVGTEQGDQPQPPAAKTRKRLPNPDKLFKPRNPTDTLGGVVQTMHRNGRSMVDRQVTRWHAARSMYRGDQYLRITRNGVKKLAPEELLPNGVRRIVINRTRPFVDARIARITKEQPHFKVVPDTHSLQDIEGARQAYKLIQANWAKGWDFEGACRESLLYSEQDGVAYVYCGFNDGVGDKYTMMIDRMDNKPVTDPGVMASYRSHDPTGDQLWYEHDMVAGDIEIRPVRAARLAVDPNATRSFEEASWVVESRTEPRWDVERAAGMSYEQLKQKNEEKKGTDSALPMPSEKSMTHLEDDDGESYQVSDDDVLTVHEMWVKPQGEFGRFPQGIHMKWVKGAENCPFVAEPWDRELPFVAIVPRGDGGHYLKSKGIIEDLAPIQVAFNRAVSMLHEWIDLVGRPPLMIQNGSLRSKGGVFNSSRVIHVNGGVSPPEFMRVPSEPAAVFGGHLAFLLEQMKEISAGHDAARGQAPGKGIEAAVSLQTLIEQTEDMLSPVAWSYARLVERVCTRTLETVAARFDLPRLVELSGVEDTGEMRAFVGSMIRGATRMKIIGSILPKQRATQIQMLIEAAQYSKQGIDLGRYVPQILSADVEGIIASEERDEQRVLRHIDRIMSWGSLENADMLLQQFHQLQQQYVQNLHQLQQMGSPHPKMEMKYLKVQPPTLKDVGLKIPVVEEFDEVYSQMAKLDDFCKTPAYENAHDLSKQGLRELRLSLQRKGAKQIAAMTEGGPQEGPPDGQQQQQPPDEQQQQEQPAAEGSAGGPA